MTTNQATIRNNFTFHNIISWRKSSRSQSNASASCVEVGAWRKSTRSSSGPGANCVEAGFWRKSSRSASGADQNCVEAGTCPHHGVAIRDSKLPTTGEYPTLSVSRADWTALLTTVNTFRH